MGAALTLKSGVSVLKDSTEALKDLTRGKTAIDKKAIHKFIGGLKISATLKKELKAITPHNYLGLR